MIRTTALDPIVVTETIDPETGQRTQHYRYRTDFEHLEHYLRQVIHKPRVLARALALNKGWKEGDVIRGYQRTQWRMPSLHIAYTTKGAVIRKHGRARWERIERRHIVKQGRREYVTMAGVLGAGL